MKNIAFTVLVVVLILYIVISKPFSSFGTFRGISNKQITKINEDGFVRIFNLVSSDELNLTPQEILTIVTNRTLPIKESLNQSYYLFIPKQRVQISGQNLVQGDAIAYLNTYNNRPQNCLLIH